ncbi:hypothetical protein I79_005595 [Cricetulus griseus]|uniref:Uncharacterized protein n=1 Tax=Cricetulus griseus TaxID=10029 RepID=G3H5L2_CRIGR|nr:hypothetical protein I79_005595 [Cricetulus griseus]
MWDNALQVMKLNNKNKITETRDGEKMARFLSHQKRQVYKQPRLSTCLTRVWINRRFL